MSSCCQSNRLCLLNQLHTGQFAIDRAAATRFIKHAIAQAKDIPPASTSDSGPTTAHVTFNADRTADTVPVPVKVTEKMLEREQYQRALREEEREEEECEDLKVIDGEEENDDDDERSSDNSPRQLELEASGVPLAAKGKSRVPSETSSGKRRRQYIDPFAGLRTFAQSHCPSCRNFYVRLSP